MAIKVFGIDEKDTWNCIVKSFKQWDVYYLCEYAISFKKHGDGEPILLYFENGEDRVCYVVMIRDIADDKKFNGRLEKNRYFDFETPYGYGGPLTDNELSIESQLFFADELKKYCIDNNVVEQFVRFHPVLKNYKMMPKLFETRYLHDTIFIDTSTEESILSNMDSACRNKIRKAQKLGVEVVCEPISNYQDFIKIYQETMDRDNATDYYYFSDEYFKSLADLNDNTCLFYAMLEGTPIASSIMYYNQTFMHYHLSGSLTSYRNYAPTNLLLYEAACWGFKRGITKLHLGGGMEQDDNLFGFKKQFNKNGRLEYYVGRTVFDKNAYGYLMDLRAEDKDFDRNNNRMTQYRA